ncbi:MAG TPA: diacylglycerol kinase family protein [Acidimicrobiales bacterium]|nr:diacylglycerol kinase family protein [Acidimicrobiales bacterium]
MRVLLVVNLTASAVTAENRILVERSLREDHDVTVIQTLKRGHARQLATQAATDGLDAVVVFGGDGTLNEAANGLVGSTTALGVLPGGSTNVFARTIGMGRRPAPATDVLRAAMAGGARKRVGVGLANGRHFLFHAGMGFDAAVVEQVESHAPLKRALGQIAFAYCAVTTWLCRYDRSEPRFTIRTGGTAQPEQTSEPSGPIEATFAICLNTNPYTFIGARPVDVDPSATLDSRLSLVAFRNIDLTTLGGVLASSLSGRGLPEHAAVVLRPDVTSVSIDGHRPFPWQVDGDLAGTADSLTLSYRPHCLDLFVPHEVRSARPED